LSLNLREQLLLRCGREDGTTTSEPSSVLPVSTQMDPTLPLILKFYGHTQTVWLLPTHAVVSGVWASSLTSVNYRMCA